MTRGLARAVRGRAAVRAVATIAVALGSAACGDAPIPTPRATVGGVAGRCVLLRPVRNPELRPGMGVEGPVPSERVLVGEGLGLGGCVVTLERIDGRPEPDAKAHDADAFEATLRVEPGRYVPHVQVVRPNTQLVLESRIDVDINVHGFLVGPAIERGETIFNVSVGPGARTNRIADAWLARAGVVFVTDDYRGGFEAWIHVVPHARFAVTSERDESGRPSGAFRIEGVPPGTWKLVVWHEGLAGGWEEPARRLIRHVRDMPIRIERTVDVRAGETARVEVGIAPPEPPR